MPPNVPAMFEKNVQAEVDRAIDFAALFAEKYYDEVRELEGITDDGLDDYADEWWLLEQFLDDAWALTVVSLYRGLSHRPLKRRR